MDIPIWACLDIAHMGPICACLLGPSVGDMAKKTSQVSTEANSGISTTICFSKDSTQDVPPSNQLHSQSAKVTVNIVKKSSQVSSVQTEAIAGTSTTMCFSKGLTSEDEHADTEPWTHEEVCILLTQLFGSKTVHSVYLCSSKCCASLSKNETRRIVPKRFNHQTFITKKNWWLVYVEGEGMYCTVCKKHCMKHSQNNAEVFSADPSVRFKHSAIITHKNSKVHRAALENELVQKVSCFHHEFTKKSEHDYMYLQRAFSVAYFLMKNFIANAKFEPLLKFIENTCGDDTLKYFHHSSGGSRQEIFMTIGETVMSNVVDDVKNAETFGILTDKVADISVTENLVTFIQYYSKSSKQVETKFLSCQNILEKFQSANAMAIKSLLVSDISEKGLDIKKLTGFSSDGASVMMGKDSGVAALLRSENPSMINIHCNPVFKNYGVNHVTVLADHFFTEARDKDKLQTQWAGFKFHICDILLPGMPEDLGKMTPTEWLLLQLLRSSGLRHFNPQLVYLAEVAASLPVTNAWPERGASVLKIIKTKQRNRLGVSMMDTLMHVGINGPPVEQSEEVIKTSVSNWLKTKTRRKVKPMKQTLISSG
ncbi:uncharacterized protein LOC132724476 [Ruditapes philippinarum]|uniref:uncharacterized protein LOC132724476 n=1 Tax=Ruditapes philippinarum TaxID=129788 RepID=UPI00295AB23E|nr:uncharacterized protein LOC132724476 [Ruditapes philippinarum]